MLKKWDDLPAFMRTPEVRPYWEILNRRRWQIRFKRVFDFVFAFILIIVLALPMAFIALMIKIEDSGPILFRQERLTTYGKSFRIHKFRTMAVDADKIGTAVSIEADPRITNVGAKLRRVRLDELPQVFDIINGDMSFVGTRPEAIQYFQHYKPEYYATLLMPAGVTSEASIRYINEDKLLNATDKVDEVYVKQILPEKMKLNLESIRRFRFFGEVSIIFRTILTVFVRNY